MKKYDYCSVYMSHKIHTKSIWTLNQTLSYWLKIVSASSKQNYPKCRVQRVRFGCGSSFAFVLHESCSCSSPTDRFPFGSALGRFYCTNTLSPVSECVCTNTHTQPQRTCCGPCTAVQTYDKHVFLILLCATVRSCQPLFHSHLAKR